MYTTSAKRKLLSEKTLAELDEKVKLGVPLARAMQGIDACRPVVSKLLDVYQMIKQHEHIPETQDVKLSLFPIWLDENNPGIQEQPEGWKYTGRFPYGQWVAPNNEND